MLVVYPTINLYILDVCVNMAATVTSKIFIFAFQLYISFFMNGFQRAPRAYLPFAANCWQVWLNTPEAKKVNFLLLLLLLQYKGKGILFIIVIAIASDIAMAIAIVIGIAIVRKEIYTLVIAMVTVTIVTVEKDGGCSRLWFWLFTN